ncbi:Asp-tRNA(Asn)/Glu-tRNA(Gln) amidotransferase subunit GatC [Candidatus Gottesmanbacteria bacterium]|nr:Asp-tRNA(Asn)/Glu-tRNA(Gln) amidotransferase subunit GatC [Candidatus Gottesmanbacteria bacterium]
MIQNKKPIHSSDIKHIAKLANLDLNDEQIKKITPQFSSVLDLVSQIQKLNTENVIETSQVTGQENVFREDEVDTKRILTEEEALSNAKNKHNGYFIVDAIFEK